MRVAFNRVFVFVVTICFTVVSAVESQELANRDIRAGERLESWVNPFNGYIHIARPRVDSVTRTRGSNVLNVYFHPSLSYYPLRESDLPLLSASLADALGRRYRKFTFIIYTNGYRVEQLVPNIFREELAPDQSRIIPYETDRTGVVQRPDQYSPPLGLTGRNIALWQSHGYFYEASLDRWEWQRAKLFGTVEDLSTMAYVIPYLTGMLERAGATVFLPRERDVSAHEVIVDNDISSGSSLFSVSLNVAVEPAGRGFLRADTLYSYQNPFRLGTALRLRQGSAAFVPEIPETGEYAVYVSWPASPDNTTAAGYRVNHTGGTRAFVVNQTVGGPTWFYLGTFHFRQGIDSVNGSVTITDASGRGMPVGLDAVKFGGGMGHVARKPAGAILPNQRSVDALVPPQPEVNTGVASFSWKTSGKPRFAEGARYWLQYAGMPDTLVYSPNGYRNDYNDDYMSRALWVNYLSASPGDDHERPKGLGIPLDIAFAFHTDAGITANDSIIGTLAIYSTASNAGVFPGGQSRMASRDLCDIIQTQIVSDLRVGFNPEWTRRGLWDRSYYEARMPNVPAMLLELLSHQNLADQMYGLDPRFRFAVSRAIYKGILKYFSYNDGRPLVVQPLPVKVFAIVPAGGMRVRLYWEPQTDPLEPSALPAEYRLYTRLGNNGFDNGIAVTGESIEIDIAEVNTVYSFKVTAVNEGGESFDSEVLSVGFATGSKGNVLIVNAFDRVSGPGWFDRDGMAGVAWWADRGVPWNNDFVTIGNQYDFDRTSPWLDDDAPGWGATWSEHEGRVMPGNTFNYPYIHGISVLRAGYSFFSVSDEYFNVNSVDPEQFSTVDIILGEEKSTPGFPDRTIGEFQIYTPPFMERVRQVAGSGINIFMSGAYTGTDTKLSCTDSTAIKFVSSILRFVPRTNLTVTSGSFHATDAASGSFSGRFSFNTGYSTDIYQVEAPDAIEPSGKGSITAFRYGQNNTSAGIASRGDYNSVVLGFPFETITGEADRDNLMKQILDFLERRQP